MTEPLDRAIYDNVEEASFRLSGTVVTYDGQPVYVHRVEPHADGVTRVVFEELPSRNLGGGPTKRKMITSKHFNRFRPVRLGFMNYFENGAGPHTSYCVRVPVRRSKQGLSGEGFSASSLISGNRLRFERVAGSAAFAEMITGTYPTFEQAMELITDNSSIAVDREFAVVCEPTGFTYLYHRTECVGLVNGTDILLRASHSYLREAIEACPNLPNAIGVYSNGRIA